MYISVIINEFPTAYYRDASSKYEECTKVRHKNQNKKKLSGNNKRRTQSGGRQCTVKIWC